MLCMLCYVCEDSQTTTYVKHVGTYHLILTAKNSIKQSKQTNRNIYVKIEFHKEGIINFKYFISASRIILFLVDFKLFYARKLDSKLVVRVFCLTVHRFLARVQSPTCTTYGEFLLKSIMAVLTAISGIRTGIPCKKIPCYMRDSA